MTHSSNDSYATFLFLPHFDVICDLLLNRRTATWNLYVKYFIDDVSKAPLQSHYHVISLTEVTRAALDEVSKAKSLPKDHI